MITDDLSKDAKSALIRVLTTSEQKLRADAEQAYAASESKVSEEAGAYFKIEARANFEAAEFVSRLRLSLIA